MFNNYNNISASTGRFCDINVSRVFILQLASSTARPKTVREGWVDTMHFMNILISSKRRQYLDSHNSQRMEKFATFRNTNYYEIFWKIKKRQLNHLITQLNSHP